MNDNAKTSGDSPESAEPKTTRERASLARVLPTDRIYFEKQVETLRAYAAEYAANGGKPVTNEKAGGIVGLSASTISQTNGFFNDIGIVSRDEQGGLKGGFIPCGEVIEYNNACQWDESEARSKLRPLFERTWFYRCLAPRLQLAPQSQATCLALLAGESKAQAEHNDRLLNLINFLELAGIVSTIGGNVSLLQNRPNKSFIETGTEITRKEERNTPLPPQGAEQHTLYLSADKKRMVTLAAPLAISNAEYTRICNWIKVALIVEDEKKGESQ
jgi:hypothetical protein